MKKDVLSVKDEQKIAVVIDIWSSTKILENLIDSNNLDRWAELFMDVDQLLASEKQNLNFEIYKFMGDGWILLFDPFLPNATELFPVLERLSDRFNDSFRKTISSLLIPPMEYRGLRMGLDIGELVRFEVNGQTEYIG